MKTTVIHDPIRIDRSKYIQKLHELHPDIILTYAQKPLWEEDKNRRAVRGCSLSHLLAVRSLLSQTESVLVFEDDAVPFEEGIAEWETAKTHIPNDAGIVLLGGETEEYGPPDEHGFRLVYPKFWGTQAVLYTEKLINTTFLLDAYEILASQNVGASQNYNGLCFESVLLQQISRTPLKIYRPPIMLYTTGRSLSDRDGQEQTPRLQNMNVK